MIFECQFWAVVKVEYVHFPGGKIDDNDTWSCFQGMWDKEDRAREWAAQQKTKGGPTKADVVHEWDYCTEHYVVVPCANVQATCLDDLGTKCETAAELQLDGVGVAASAAEGKL